MDARPRSHAFVARGGKMLILQGALQSRWWGQPGGIIETGEGAAEAVIRETREETGLRIAAPELLRTWSYHDRRGDEVTCYSFAAEAYPGNVVLSSEHSDFAWVSPSAYAERYCSEQTAAMAPGWARRFLAEMRENCTLFEQWLRVRSAG